MGLFDFLKKKENPTEIQENKTLLAMPMFGSDNRYELTSIVDALKNDWGLTVSHIEGDNESAILTIDEQNVVIVFIPAPIPSAEIEQAVSYAYYWPTAKEDLKNFTGHSLVSIMSASKPAIEKYKPLSKVLHAILSTTDAIGVYQGSQTLLIPKYQYIEMTEYLKNDDLPVNLWVYFGLRQTEEGNSIYTYGLNAFGKPEMEVIHSKLSLEELYNLISNVCTYVIRSNVTFKNGETLGYTAEQKIKITLSKGQFVEGQTLKLTI